VVDGKFVWDDGTVLGWFANLKVPLKRTRLIQLERRRREAAGSMMPKVEKGTSLDCTASRTTHDSMSPFRARQTTASHAATTAAPRAGRSDQYVIAGPIN
jgi:hypothetical protein